MGSRPPLAKWCHRIMHEGAVNRKKSLASFLSPGVSTTSESSATLHSTSTHGSLVGINFSTTIFDENARIGVTFFLRDRN
ncbi:hypothetical protein Tcan_15240 [Toxocara canis]|uniref:Uncharacterized protein n=1 Tax=Toxocara canis TaxID=6265 RepID=A0A0B2VJM7_TOXCA|nr:hypothetical protein Tcan_15240 [Toxocara canis]